MNKSLLLYIIIIVQTFSLAGNSSKLSTNQKTNIVDVTSNLTYVGNPFKNEVYARNIWDMQVFNNSIYFGYGNSSNDGPSPNAGPIDIMKLDIKSGKFIKEATVDEEQIDIYRILNSKLYVPGHDPRDSWDFGNIYLLNGKWEKIRSLPDAIHVYDLAVYGDYLYAATGTQGFGELLASKDQGKSWISIHAKNMPFFTYGGRVYSLFLFNGKLYASGTLSNDDNFRHNKILCQDDEEISLTEFKGSKFFPSLSSNRKIKMARVTEFKKQLIFIAGEVTNDHQYIPLALYVTKDVLASNKISFPEKSSLPYDIITRGENIFILTSMKTIEGKYTNIVYKSNNAKTWKELFRFRSDTFARSFEEYNGNFYFGLGCDTDILNESTGNIYMVKKSCYLR